MRLVFVIAVASLVLAGAAQAATPEQRYYTTKAQVASLQHQIAEAALSPSIDGWAQILDEERFVYLSHRLAATWKQYVFWRRVMFDPYTAIRFVFGPHAGGAWNVALCEGGRPVPSVNAANGQYLGMFQMGSFARSAYGHASYALGQARAAYRYFVAAGRDWSPWECKP